MALGFEAVTTFDVKGVFEFTPQVYRDERGYLVRHFDKKIFDKHGINTGIVQITSQSSVHKNVLRGLHVSLPPSCEGKMLTAVRGRIFWVAVDVRKVSPTFGKAISTILSEEKHNVFCVAPGFAHGVMSLEDNCHLLASTDNYFSDERSTGIVWNDPDLAINWPKTDTQLTILERDLKYGSFKDFVKDFGGVEV